MIIIKSPLVLNILYRDSWELEQLAVLADTVARQKSLTADIVCQASNVGRKSFPADQIAEINKVFNLDCFPRQEEFGALMAGVIQRLQNDGFVAAVESKGMVCRQCDLFALEATTCPRCGQKLIKGSGMTWVLHPSPGQEADGREPISVFPRGQQLTAGSIPKEMPLAQGLWDMPVEKALPVPWFSGFIQCLALAGYADEKRFAKVWPESWVFATRDYWQEYLEWWSLILHLLGLPRPGVAAFQPHILVDRRNQPVASVLLAKNYGTDAIRYVILSVKPGSSDGRLTEDQIIQKINQDLANELGNLVSRVIAMVERYADGLVPKPDVLTRTTADLELREVALVTPAAVADSLNSLEPHLALNSVRRLIAQTNRFIEATTPWNLITGAANQERLQTVLYNLCESLRFIAIILMPLLPETAEKILGQFGLARGRLYKQWNSLQQWGLLPVGTRVTSLPPLFPRIVPGKTTVTEPELILREELSRLRLVVARVVSAEKVPTADWLLQLVLYDGSQRRRVLTPIARYYSPSDLAGRKVILVANLRPSVLEGIMSEGEVLLADTDDGGLTLVQVDPDTAEGSKVYAIPD